jgi:lysine-N-methylase
MILSKPRYFDDFSCIAGRCPDSCCKEWDVQVDDASAALYRSLPGNLGDRLRQVLVEEDGETLMLIEEGRCPMWRTDGLCRIQAELGEGALCKTCREFPRLTHDYGDFQERNLELSCPEAARIILSAQPGWVSEEVPGGDEPEYDADAMEALKASREVVYKLLADASHPVAQTLALALIYGYQAQGQLDGDEPVPFDPDSAMATVREFAKPGDMDALLAFFRDLEILNPNWLTRLDQPVPGNFDDRYRLLARYFVDRYWLQAVSDYDLSGRVKFMIVSCLLIRHLGGDLADTAQSYSKEIENSAENLDAILDAAYSHPAFTDDKLLGLLLHA